MYVEKSVLIFTSVTIGLQARRCRSEFALQVQSPCFVAFTFIFTVAVTTLRNNLLPLLQPQCRPTSPPGEDK